MGLSGDGDCVCECESAECVSESVFAEAMSRGSPAWRQGTTGEADAASQGPEVSSPSDENRPRGTSRYLPEQEMFYLFIYDVC